MPGALADRPLRVVDDAQVVALDDEERGRGETLLLAQLTQLLLGLAGGRAHAGAVQLLPDRLGRALQFQLHQALARLPQVGLQEHHRRAQHQGRHRQHDEQRQQVESRRDLHGRSLPQNLNWSTLSFVNTMTGSATCRLIASLRGVKRPSRPASKA